MKKLLFVIVCVSCFFIIGLNAQEYPQILEDDDNFILDIPYILYEDSAGDTKALAAELIAPKNGSEISFSINSSSE